MNSVEVIPGPGIVIRIGAVVGWAEPANSGPGSAIEAVLQRLGAVAEGRTPVEELGGQLLGILNGDSARSVPALAVVVPGPSGPIAIAHGWGHVVADGVLVTGAWSVRQLPPVAMLALGRSDVARPPASPTPGLDLRDGVVPGGAAVLTLVRAVAPGPSAQASIAPPFPANAPRTAPTGAPISPSSPGTPAVPTLAPPAQPGPATSRADPMPPASTGASGTPHPPGVGPKVVSLSGPIPGLPEREPLPVREPLPTGSEPEPAIDTTTSTDGPTENAGHAHVHVEGVMCSRRHFNNPIALYCRVCGISMLQQTHVLVGGDRPPLGVLVCDDGTTFGIDQDYVVGAAPDGAPEVLQSGARPLSLGDPGGSVEPVHALVHLDGWHVTVLNRSAAGTTWVLERAGGNWVVVPRDGAVRLDPGAQVAVGARRFVFESNARA